VAPGTDPDDSALLGWALVCGTVLASPLLVGAAQGERDLASTLGTWLVLLVVSWLGCNLVGGLLELLGGEARRADDTVAGTAGGESPWSAGGPTGAPDSGTRVDPPDPAGTADGPADDDADVAAPGGAGPDG
jgi:hypothetical protein